MVGGWPSVRESLGSTPTLHELAMVLGGRHATDRSRGQKFKVTLGY